VAKSTASEGIMTAHGRRSNTERSTGQSHDPPMLTRDAALVVISTGSGPDAIHCATRDTRRARVAVAGTLVWPWPFR
jgi:hypothetical protein